MNFETKSDAVRNKEIKWRKGTLSVLEWIQNVDVSILYFIQESLRYEFLNGFWRAVTFLGDGGWFWIAASVLLLFFRKTRTVGMAALVSMAVCFLITNVALKNLVARVRPYDAFPILLPLIDKPTDFSFPSGHTCASFAAALVYVQMLPKRFGIPAVILAGMIAFSRMYLGVHYPSDILGGFLVALIVSILICRRIAEKTQSTI